MKSMDNNNWLGFSLLSPHMSMEISADPRHHHETQAAVASSAPAAFFLPPDQRLDSSGICYGAETGNGGFRSSLAVMPLKSDGSLCIMEALSRSQQPGPKLEDFMGTSHYPSNEKESMPLSLDSNSIYDRQNFMGLLPPCKEVIPGQEHEYFRPLQEGICSALGGDELFQTPLEDAGPKPHQLAGSNLQSLSLSMSPNSQSSYVAAAQQIPYSAGFPDCASMDSRKRGMNGNGVLRQQPIHRKSIDTFGQRTSQYRGVTRHRWTGRYEAHLWDNSCKKEGQTRKGRQVYLGGYDMEEKAARAYDLAAIKYWGTSTHINFPLENYQDELLEMKSMTRQEYVAHLRRKSSGFSRGASMYRGVTRHHQHGRWQARIGRVAGNKDLYLGTFSTQEEAAEAYDIAAIKFRGVNAVTNFDISRYNVELILSSNALLAGELAKRNTEIETSTEAIDHPSAQNCSQELEAAEEIINGDSNWKVVLFQSSLPLQPLDDSQLEQKLSSNENYRGPSFSSSLNEFVSNDTVNSAAAAHLSNNISLLNSVSTSREGSPDQMCVPMLLGKAPASKTLGSSPMNSWMASRQTEPAISMAQLPVFGAWD